MNKEFAVIQLKKEFEKPREISVGSKSIKLAPGETTEVPREDADRWLDTGQVEIVKFVTKDVADEAETPQPAAESDLPADIPARYVLIREGVDWAKLNSLDKDALLEIKGIGRNFADQILIYLHPETKEEIEGGEN